MLLVGRNTFLISNLRLEILNGVRELNFKGDGLDSENLNEDLHANSQTKNEV